jgi:hypothetical protein
MSRSAAISGTGSGAGLFRATSSPRHSLQTHAGRRAARVKWRRGGWVVAGAGAGGFAQAPLLGFLGHGRFNNGRRWIHDRA